jgi:hypothetical protein
MLKNVDISGDTNVTKREAQMIPKHKHRTTETQRICCIKTKVIPVSGAMKPSQYHSEISEQHDGKARNRGTIDNSHTGHCKHTAEITGVKHRTLVMANNNTCCINCKYITAVN